ncbi:lysylphosphatidylglycerol synthase transmembrane domain-containing protein [Bacteriovoracaceae bacterium]|nr:lysylphosphatidylglycerol synthase transmembrane domain-containing protein [Bacteriovoracaceae bacterium]
MKHIKTLLKFSFAIGIIVYLIRSGRLDFSLITKSFQSGWGWLICAGILFSIDCLSSFRWRWILKTNSQNPLPIKKVIGVTYIGLFFNSFLPGAVTGDLIKLVYAKDLDKSLSKTFLVTSVLIDRIFGLIGLLLVLSISSLIYYNELITLSPKMTNLIHFNLFLGLGAVGFLGTLFFPANLQKVLLDIFTKVPVLGSKIVKTLKEVWVIGSRKDVVAKAILFSAIVQTLNIVAFYILTSPFYSHPIPLQYILTFIPIGFVAVAIPISPAGLGVGHVIFDTLFNMVGIPGGASFFNIYFVIRVCGNLLGIIPYLLSGRKHSLQETEEFA